MINSKQLSNHFLIAMPALSDPNFDHSVTYICEHNADGALGIVINRPLDINLGEMLEHLEIGTERQAVKDLTIFQGGPVQRERGFVLHDPVEHAWEASLNVSPKVSLTSSRDILDSIAAGTGPERYLIALGYAGWSAGQLEEEMSENAWLSAPGDTSLLFDTPVASRWSAAAALLGVDMNAMATGAGHG